MPPPTHPLYESLPHLNDTFDVNEAETSAKTIVPLIVPHATDANVSEINLEVVSGGATNKLWKCSFILKQGAMVANTEFPPVIDRICVAPRCIFGCLSC